MELLFIVCGYGWDPYSMWFLYLYSESGSELGSCQEIEQRTKFL
jgi:hypothetical protein